MINVCWISNAPAPYKVELMNMLGVEVNLICLFEFRSEADRNSNWYNYDSNNFKSIYLSKNNAKKIIKECSKTCDVLIDSDYSKIICMYAVNQFHKQHKPVLMHAVGGLAVPRGIMDFVISYFINKHDYFMSSGNTTDHYYTYYSVPIDRIKHYHFSCMSNSLLINHANMVQNKEKYRTLCGYRETNIFLSVGQQIPRKGYDILAKSLKGTNPSEIGVYVIGGTPEDSVQSYLEEEKITNMHFLPFMAPEQLASYYAGADAFVLPTRYDIWGLVINEAMSFGLPIITTDHCVAGIEFQGKFNNCEIIPVENPEKLRFAIQEFVENIGERRKKGIRSLEGIRSYSMESMTKDFIRILIETTSMLD